MRVWRQPCADVRSPAPHLTTTTSARPRHSPITPTDHSFDNGNLGIGERHACKMGLEGIVSKRLGSRYRSGRSPDWLKFKNPEAPAVKREAEEDWRRAPR